MLHAPQYWRTFKKRKRFEQNAAFQKFVHLMEANSAHLDWLMLLMNDYANYLRAYDVDYPRCGEVRAGVETDSSLR